MLKHLHFWLFNNQTGPILLPRYPLTYVNLHAKYGNNLIRTIKVIVRTMKYLRNVIQCNNGIRGGVTTEQ